MLTDRVIRSSPVSLVQLLERVRSDNRVEVIPVGVPVPLQEAAVLEVAQRDLEVDNSLATPGRVFEQRRLVLLDVPNSCLLIGFMPRDGCVAHSLQGFSSFTCLGRFQ